MRCLREGNELLRSGPRHDAAAGAPRHRRHRGDRRAGPPGGPGFAAALDGVHTLYLVSAVEIWCRPSRSRTGCSSTATEEAIAATGLAWTALRHSLYADFVPSLAVPAGDGRAVIAGPAGTGRASFVSRDDCADVAAAVLQEVSGVPVAYREESVEEAWASRRPSGHPDWEIEGWISSYTSIAAGEMAAVTDVVPTLTGHPARTLAEQLRASPEDAAHLSA
jgi:NAD(P)H dehydrogenase (quinone)